MRGTIWGCRVELVALLALALTACGGKPVAPAAKPEWRTGFWFWQGSSAAISASAGPVDVLYVNADAGLPKRLPEAREYWLVFRWEKRGVPQPEFAARVAEAAASVRLPVVGVQLDVDCPTRALGDYAAFLRRLRSELGSGRKISITALLDWFRIGTAVGEVIEQVDEFVPQFYDIQSRDSYGGGMAIAALIDGGKWGPVFNRYGKPFRVGISTFGRASLLKPDSRSPPASYRDLDPLDLALDRGFRLTASRSAAGELVLTYRAAREVRVGYQRFDDGDRVEFITPTAEGIRAAAEEVRRMGGNCAGVVLFRWPSVRETLGVDPEAALAAVNGAPAARAATVRATDGGCAAVSCVDLYLSTSGVRAAQPVRYSIRSSVALDYFLPASRMPARMTGASEIELSLPPYCVRGAMELGRAVSSRRASFTVEEAR